jgi:hypothetical protein
MMMTLGKAVCAFSATSNRLVLIESEDPGGNIGVFLLALEHRMDVPSRGLRRADNRDRFFADAALRVRTMHQSSALPYRKYGL